MRIKRYEERGNREDTLIVLRVARHVMEWKSKNGGKIAVKNMSVNHIRNTIKTIEGGKGGYYDGYPSKTWVDVLSGELIYRKEKVDKWLGRFPKLYASLVKVHFITPFNIDDKE